jgi:zinc protease
VAPPRLTPDYHPLEVMNTLLGGSFTSRLNDNLREQHGYSYGAGSALVLRRSSGLFFVATSVQTPSTADALKECLKELEGIRAPARPEEIERARNYLALSYGQEFETTEQIASKLVEQALYALPADAYSSFVPTVLGVSVSEVERVAKAHVDPSRVAIVVVGDRKTIEGPLKAMNLGPMKVVSVDELLGPAPYAD